jgi:hypothetical protein
MCQHHFKPNCRKNERIEKLIEKCKIFTVVNSVRKDLLSRINQVYYLLLFSKTHEHYNYNITFFKNWKLFMKGN